MAGADQVHPHPAGTPNPIGAWLGRLVPWRVRRWHRGPLRGCVDSLDLFCVAGWATDLDHPERAASLDVWINGVCAGQIECGSPRRDASVRGYRGARSFLWDPSPHLVEGWNDLELRFSDSGVALGPGPMRLYRGREALATRIADSWNAGSAHPHLRTRWWQCDRIRRHINAKVCGEPIDGLSAGLFRRAQQTLGDELPLRAGVSVGGGSGVKERAAIAAGLVEHFVIYELSDERIRAGRAETKRLGLADRFEYRQEDAFQREEGAGVYDLVFWNNALHHMFDVDAALRWSHRVLREGGVLLLDEYVGPNRMQFDDAILEASTRYREGIPRALLADPAHPGERLARRMALPDVALIVRRDPSEAVDSAQILPCLSRYFSDVDLVHTGGAVYAVGLNDVLHNLIETEDWDTLDTALALDDECLAQGHSLHATAIARR